MYQRSRTYLLALILLVGMTGCDSGDSNDEGDSGNLSNGRFTLSTSGAIEMNTEGTAYFGEVTDPDTGEDFFALYLVEENSSGAGGNFVWVAREGTRPGQNIYPLIDIEVDDDLSTGFGAYAVLGGSSSTVSWIVSTGGTLTIDGSSSDQVLGSLSLEGTMISFTGGGTQEEDVEIEATFNAVDGSNNLFIPDF